MTSSLRSGAGDVMPALETGSGRFCFWLQTAPAGSVAEYHRGFLAIDAPPNLALGTEADWNEICLVRHLAFEAGQHRLVHLLQRRLGPSCFAYLAVRRGHPAKHDIPATRPVEVAGAS